MEWAIVFGALCTVTDCARQKIEGWLLIAGAAAGLGIMAWRIWQGELAWYELFLAVLPGALLWLGGKGSRGKLGAGDGDMVIVLGLFLGWELCLAVLCLACLLAAAAAGLGLAAGRLTGSSRIPFAPFLLAATVAVGALLSGGGK